jgi:hypothetical protein
MPVLSAIPARCAPGDMARINAMIAGMGPG